MDTPAVELKIINFDSQGNPIFIIGARQFGTVEQVIFYKIIKEFYCSCGEMLILCTNKLVLGKPLEPHGWRKNKKGYWTCGAKGHSQMKEKNWKRWYGKVK